jgi:hypothetical protein
MEIGRESEQDRTDTGKRKTTMGSANRAGRWLAEGPKESPSPVLSCRLYGVALAVSTTRTKNPVFRFGTVTKY